MEAECGESENHVLLSTIHSAKGLEWPIVFFARFNRGVIPWESDADAVDDAYGDDDGNSRKVNPRIEEERRLAYVAMTRAKQTLYLSFVNRHVSGAPMVCGFVWFFMYLGVICFGWSAVVGMWVLRKKMTFFLLLTFFLSLTYFSLLHPF